jgi:hypothetical protein
VATYEIISKDIDLIDGRVIMTVGFDIDLPGQAEPTRYQQQVAMPAADPEQAEALQAYADDYERALHENPPEDSVDPESPDPEGLPQ